MNARLSNMPRPDSKVMLQPIDVIFRALQSISFFDSTCTVIDCALGYDSLIGLQDACSDLALRPDEYSN